MKAGIARITITPPVGVELSGAPFGPSVGILDELEAQALVVDRQGDQAAIITADLIGFSRELVTAIRERIEASLGIPGSQVLLAGSHTHSGPATIFLRNWGRVDEAYVRVLAAQLVGLVAMAQCGAVEARIGTALGYANTVIENRRVTDGVVDPAVPVLRIDDLRGQPLVVLYNFACHPVSLHSYENLISPDYPGYARSTVKAAMGERIGVMFTLGAAGDINPRDYIAKQTTPQRSRQIGTILGCEVAKTALGISTVPHAVLRVITRTVDLPVEPLPSASELRATYERIVGGADSRPGAAVIRDWAAEALREWETGTPCRSRACDLQGIRLGDAAIVALPLEVFVETGLAIKRTSPAALTILCSNANGALGYLPTAQAYTVEDYTNPEGIAPKVYGLYAFSPEAEPLIRAEATHLLAALFQDGAGDL